MPARTPLVKVIRLGRIKAKVRQMASDVVPPTEEGARPARVWYLVTITRLFLLRGQWREATTFCRDDLPLVAKLADLAHSWIFERAQRTAAPENPLPSETPPENS